MNRLFTFLSGIVFLCCTLPLSAQIQSARIEGSIIDSSKAVIPGAKVSIVNSRTQQKQDAESDAQGYFVFPAVNPGIYTLNAEAQGFRKATVTNLEVNVGLSIKQEVKMEVGSVSETLSFQCVHGSHTTASAGRQSAVRSERD